MKYTSMIASIVLLIVLTSTDFVSSHSGRTDSKGGHTDSKTGIYHFHNNKEEAKPAEVPQTKWGNQFQYKEFYKVITHVELPDFDDYPRTEIRRMSKALEAVINNHLRRDMVGYEVDQLSTFIYQGAIFYTVIMKGNDLPPYKYNLKE